MTATDTQEDKAPGSGERVTGWRLDPDQRMELLQQFPPRFDNVVADHVTLESGAAERSPLPEPLHGEIIGQVSDGKGVEAMVVQIDGTTERPDGGTFHITWSLADGRQAGESNDVLAATGWEPFDLPMPVKLDPARLR